MNGLRGDSGGRSAAGPDEPFIRPADLSAAARRALVAGMLRAFGGGDPGPAEPEFPLRWWGARLYMLGGARAVVLRLPRPGAAGGALAPVYLDRLWNERRPGRGDGGALLRRIVEGAAAGEARTGLPASFACGTAAPPGLDRTDYQRSRSFREPSEAAHRIVWWRTRDPEYYARRAAERGWRLRALRASCREDKVFMGVGCARWAWEAEDVSWLRMPSAV
jgi:hypothetical protein